MKVFVLHKLKKGKTMDQYRMYSREIDQPDMVEAPGINKYEVYEIQGSEDKKEPKYDILEIMTVDSWEEFIKNEYSEEHKEARQMWLDEWVEEGTDLTYFGDEIV
jgi:hypothetical protein